MDLVTITNGINETERKVRELAAVEGLPADAKEALEKIGKALNELGNESFRAQCDIEKAQGIYELLLSETFLDSSGLDDEQLLKLQHNHKSNSILAHVLGDYLYPTM